jgi:hypothetical protein
MTTSIPDYSSVVSATGFLRPRASRSISSFQTHLTESPRILALLGAGLSAPSGLPTFRGAGGLWKTHDAKQLSTPQAFEENPGLVWEFYLERRAAAREARPNRAHVVLAELARRVTGFMAISMNIDGKVDFFRLIHLIIDYCKSSVSYFASDISLRNCQTSYRQLSHLIFLFLIYKLNVTPYFLHLP